MGAKIGLFVFVVVAMFIGSWITLIQWIIVTIGLNWYYGDDPAYQKWKREGGRPYWDTVTWPNGPIGASAWMPDSFASQPIEKETGLAEPQYTGFVPPADWRFQCPVCGSRVQYKIGRAHV